jgi:hypothetical protein
MLSYRDLVGPAIKTGAKEPPSPGIAHVAIPTNGRFYHLERAIESYVACVQLYARTPQFFIADGTRSAQAQGITQALIQKVAKSSGLEFYYSGTQEKCSFLKYLTDQCEVPSEVLEFGLMGPRNCEVKTGANRNAILLQTLGDIVLSADDDSQCKVGSLASEDERRMICLGGEWNIPEVWSFADREAALKSISPISIDIFDEHETLLGKSLTQVVSKNHSGLLKFENPCAHLLESLLSAEGTIPVTFAGVAGDSGQSPYVAALFHSQATRTRFTRSEHHYATAMASREVVRQYLSKTVCHSGAPMTTTVGLDNRALLPPFFPGYRNQDGIFAATISKCLRQTFFGHIPWALAHDPPSARKSHSKLGSAFRISEIVIGLVSEWHNSSHNDSEGECLISLGRYLINVGSLSEREFGERVRLVFLNRISKIISRGEMLISNSGGGPDYWVRDLKDQVCELLNSVESQFCELPIDLVEDVGPGQVLLTAKDLVKRFGELLYWWPAILDGVRALSSLGIRIGRRLN